MIGNYERNYLQWIQKVSEEIERVFVLNNEKTIIL